MTILVSKLASGYDNPKEGQFQAKLIWVSYLEQSLSFARVSISNVFLPFEKCIFLNNLQVIEIYKPSQQHTCKNNLKTAQPKQHMKPNAGIMGAVKTNLFGNHATSTLHINLKTQFRSSSTAISITYRFPCA